MLHIHVYTHSRCDMSGIWMYASLLCCRGVMHDSAMTYAMKSCEQFV